MKIELTKTNNLDISPSIIKTLSSDFKVPIYNHLYKLRHPLGIYNVSISRVLSLFSQVVTQLDTIKTPEQFLKQDLQEVVEWSNFLLHSQEELLYALMEHMDDCENILKCFYPPKTG